MMKDSFEVILGDRKDSAKHLYGIVKFFFDYPNFKDKNNGLDGVFYELAFAHLCKQFMVSVGGTGIHERTFWKQIKVFLSSEVFSEAEYEEHPWIKIHQFQLVICKDLAGVFRTKKLQWRFFGMTLTPGSYVVPLKLLHKLFPCLGNELLEIELDAKKVCVGLVKRASQYGHFAYAELKFVKSILAWFEYPTSDFQFQFSFCLQEEDLIQTFELRNDEAGFFIQQGHKENFKLGKMKQVYSYRYWTINGRAQSSGSLDEFEKSSIHVIESQGKNLDLNFSADKVNAKISMDLM
jgi:hypothetical protein